MYCKHCGKQIADDANFCKYCGGKLVEAETVKRDNDIIISTEDDRKNSQQTEQIEQQELSHRTEYYEDNSYSTEVISTNYSARDTGINPVDLKDGVDKAKKKRNIIIAVAIIIALGVIAGVVIVTSLSQGRDYFGLQKYDSSSRLMDEYEKSEFENNDEDTETPAEQSGNSNSHTPLPTVNAIVE